MWNKIQNWLIISKHMPEKVEVPYEIRKKEKEPNGAKQWF